MKNKNGFTLIELLAVVVILAIIMLIAGPIIVDLIENAQKGSFKNTAYGIIEAGKYNYTNEIIKSSDIKAMSFSYEDGVEISNPSGRKLDYKGERPKTGAVLLNAEGQIAIAIHNGRYCVEKNYTDVQVTISEKAEAECLLTLNFDTSNASVPILEDNMIPVKWDGTKWIKVSTNNIPGALQWYDYTAKQWANVVLVTEAQRAMYETAVVGTEVQEADIMAYLVWIPRYRYKLFNVSTTANVALQTIDISFEDKTTAKSIGTTVGSYLTHPAFTLGTTELNGIWVGKFETTGVAATPTIKPNVTSLRSQSAYAQYTTAKLFNTTTTYGLTSANDAHVMKNTEWGAVAYLSQSAYGKNGEVWINPTSTYITGCAGDGASAVSTTVCQKYDTANGQQASTTGNIYGVYDMSGSAYEATMGVMYNTGNTTLMLSASGFTAAIIDDASMSKYIDKYNYATSYSDYSRRIMGDATTETRAWYLDHYRAVYVSATPTYNSWTIRGYVYSGLTASGIFGYYYTTGGASSAVAFRTVVISE